MPVNQLNQLQQAMAAGGQQGVDPQADVPDSAPGGPQQLSGPTGQEAVAPQEEQAPQEAADPSDPFGGMSLEEKQQKLLNFENPLGDLADPVIDDSGDDDSLFGGASVPERVFQGMADYYQFAGNVSLKAGLGVSSGAKSFVEGIGLFAVDAATAIGIVDDADTQGIRSTVAENRAARKSQSDAVGPQGGSLPFQAGELVSQTALSMAGASGLVKGAGSTIARTLGSKAPKALSALQKVAPSAKTLVGQGVRAAPGVALGGALLDEEDRARGASVALLAQATVVGAGAGYRKGFSPRVAESEASFSRMGVEPTAKQLKGGAKKGSEQLDQLKQNATRAVVDTKRDSAHWVKTFGKEITEREQKFKDVTNRVLTKVLGNYEAKKVHTFNQSKELYLKARPALAKNAESSVKNVVTQMDDLFQGPMNIRTAADQTLSMGTFENLMAPLKGRVPGVWQSVKQLKGTFQGELDDALKAISPKTFKRYSKGKAIAAKRITEIGDDAITKAIRKGDFDNIITSLSKSTGKDSLKKINTALGANGDKILRHGLVQNAARRSLGTDGLIDPKKFLTTINKIKSGSGFKFGKEMNQHINDINNVLTDLTNNPKAYIQASGAIGKAGGVNQFRSVEMIQMGVRKLMDTPLGLKVISKAAKGSTAEQRAHNIITVISQATAGAAASERAESQSLPPEQVDQTFDSMSLEDKQALLQKLEGQ